jgi:hypothetical protein
MSWVLYSSKSVLYWVLYSRGKPVPLEKETLKGRWSTVLVTALSSWGKAIPLEKETRVGSPSLSSPILQARVA